jgi:flagellar basal-body rod modification protein FlgD
MSVSSATAAAAVQSSAAALAKSSSSSSSSSSSTTATQTTMDYNSFLKLLVAELQNQDPTNPTDPTQQLSQLASFSAVEQQVATNAKLDSLLSASALSQASAAIGRTVTSSDGSVSGVVRSVVLASEGPVAVLQNGGTLLLGTGIVVS